MSHIDLTTAALAQTKRLAQFVPGWDPKIMGTREPEHRIFEADGLIQELDVDIVLRDGTILRGNIYRAEHLRNHQLPVILNYSVYGKDGAVDICVFPASCGLDRSRLSKHYIFEAADPGWWCPRGYAVASVDVRGSHKSEGDKGYYSRDVGLDGFDVVEWLAKQPWSNGRVAMYGASGYAMVQWLVAAERPPSLAAIIPIDGMTDIYREMAFKGGIPEKQFSELYPYFWNWGSSLVEDSLHGPKNHPFFDDYWRSKIPYLGRIECPAYIICSWGDHCLHTRGTLNAWKSIASKDRYLEIHQYQKWEWSLTEESLGRQKAFLDRYLAGCTTNEVSSWPRVRYTMRESFYNGEWRSSRAFPLDDTEYTKMHLTASGGLSRIPPGQEDVVSYDALEGEVSFDLPIVQSTLEFAGHAKLRLWVEAEGHDNMDLFITLQKLDRRGQPVHFPWLTVVDTGPIAFGFLRASRREICGERSTTYQPVHRHERDIPMPSGEAVPVEVEILPTSCRLRPGERLRLSVSGHDYGSYPPGIPVARHPETINRGRHLVRFGGRYDSHLQLPVIPSPSGAYDKQMKPVIMAMLARRQPGWGDARFTHEYTKVHADVTRQVAASVPILRGYTQLVAVPRLPLTFGLPPTAAEAASDAWDCSTILRWSTLPAMWGSFQSPSYKAGASKHVFADEAASVGILAVAESDYVFDPIGMERRAAGPSEKSGDDDGAVMLIIYLAGSVAAPPHGEGASARRRARAESVVSATRAGGGGNLLRYVMSRSVTPADPASFFADTPFAAADWTTMVAVEQYWFSDATAAAAFLNHDDIQACLQSSETAAFDLSKSISLIGREHRVVCKDAD